MAQSFIDKLYQTRFRGLSFSAPAVTSRTTEAQVVRSVLHMLQGFSSPLFYWDDREHTFHVKNDIHVAHLSLSSLSDILSRFIHAANCLQLVEGFIKHIRMYSQMYPPTMKAFTDSVFERLKNLRKVALSEEEESTKLDNGTKTTLLALVENLKCICAGAEFLLQIVREAVPCHYLDAQYSIHASEMAVHILDYLYLRLNEDCLVQDGEDGAYHTLLILFISSLQPLIQRIDSWLYEGILDDPFEELFFHANDAITIDEATFWQKGYSLRQVVSRATNKDDTTSSSSKQLLLGESCLAKSKVDANNIVCPLFLQELAKPIMSTGKSLQLLRHVPWVHSNVYNKEQEFENSNFSVLKKSTTNLSQPIEDILGTRTRGFLLLEDNELTDSGGYPDHKPASQVKHMLHTKGISGLSLSELFCISFVALVADNVHLCKYFNQEYPWSPEIGRICKSFMDEENLEDSIDKRSASTSNGKIWCDFFRETILQKTNVSKEGGKVHGVHDLSGEATLGIQSINPLSPHNPHVSICSSLLEKNHPLWEKLSVSTFWFLPPLNDKPLREAIFGRSNDHVTTDYISCLGLSKLDRNSLKDIEALYPFPTILPCLQEGLSVMDFLPYQKNSSVILKVLSWIQQFEVKIQLLPVVIVQECLTVYIKKQVDYVGKQILSKLMNNWRLLDELALLRAIYLLGSGDLLQQFSTVLFDKLDEGEPWDDYFELNTMLQDSIRNSADGTLLGSPDSLTVTISHHNQDSNESQPSLGPSLLISGSQFFGINAFDMLEFTYKVSWPLEVIANQDAMRKYNQVLAFLLKVERAKFVLDKTRRWMWKDRSSSNVSHKHHLLPQQKLLHFVDAFHQYVMDRVLHNAWLELSEGMGSARSLDEVIEVHESYLISIQRQCFVASDKLLVLIASRIKSILGLALDFHAIQRTLYSGGAAPAIKARCEMEVDRIEKQFDDCIAFLLKVLSSKTNVGHFPHLADLVTRINYNYFYMSDDGSLLTVPGVETTASRTGQPNLASR